MNALLRRFALTLGFVSGAVGSWHPLAAKDPAPASSAPSSSAPTSSAPASSAQITAVLQPFVDSHSLAGAVTLIADKDNVLSLDAVGYADIEAGKPMRKDALFWIASQSKAITATALMMLVDDGKVRLDDPVEKFLPEFRGQWLEVEKDNEHKLLRHPERPITIRQILSHMSGLPFKSILEQPTLDMVPLGVVVRSYAITPLQAPPNTKYMYSNAGINTVGRVIEVVSGMKYEDFLDQRLFQPLGMKDTTFWPNEEQLARLAHSYKPTSDKTHLEPIKIPYLSYPLDDRRRQPIPGGGLFSTAQDVGRFCQMILAGGEFAGRRYVSADAVKEMSTRQTPTSVNVSYGLGWSVGDGKFDHGGAFATNMLVDTSRGLVAIYLVQHEGFANDGNKSQGAFHKAMYQQFGKSR